MSERVGNRRSSTQGALEDLGVLITAAWGVNRDWVEDARCAEYAKPYPFMPTPWQFSDKQVATYPLGKGKVTVAGAEMVKVALLVCSTCPVQYDCATYAVTARVTGGTWSMPVRQLVWLTKEPDALALIERARRQGVAVQHAVDEVFRAHLAARAALAAAVPDRFRP